MGLGVRVKVRAGILIFYLPVERAVHFPEHSYANYKQTDAKPRGF